MSEPTSTPKKHIFLTGGSGYIGSAIIQLAQQQGKYTISSLSRSEASDAKLLALGATPIRGDLTDGPAVHDTLRTAAASADIVIHLADTFFNDPTQDYTNVIRTDAAAIDALAAGLAGTAKPLITTSGTLVVAPTGAETDETSPPNPTPLNGRIKAEQHALALGDAGVDVRVVRLAPFVYGRGGSGVRLFMGMFAQAGEAPVVDGGEKLTSTVHVEDAAALYLLVAERAARGDVFNAVAEHVRFRELIGAVGEVMGLPVRDVTREEAEKRWGVFVARFLSAENIASAAKARRVLGWEPKAVGNLEDVRKGSYVEVADGLKKQAQQSS